MAFSFQVRSSVGRWVPILASACFLLGAALATFSNSRLREDGYPYPTVGTAGANESGSTTSGGVPARPPPIPWTGAGGPVVGGPGEWGTGDGGPSGEVTDPVITTNLIVFLPFDGNVLGDTSTNNLPVMVYAGYTNAVSFASLTYTNAQVLEPAYSAGSPRVASFLQDQQLFHFGSRTASDGDFGYPGIVADLGGTVFDGFTTNFTMAAWVFTGSGGLAKVDGYDATIMGISSLSENFVWARVIFGNEQVQLQWNTTYDGTVTDESVDTFPEWNNNAVSNEFKWVFVAGSVDLATNVGRLDIYDPSWDGLISVTEDEGTHTSFDMSAHTPHFWMGGFPSTAANASERTYWAGPIDAGRLYDRVLTTNEIVQIAQADYASIITQHTNWYQSATWTEPWAHWEFTGGSLTNTGNGGADLAWMTRGTVTATDDYIVLDSDADGLYFDPNTLDARIFQIMHQQFNGGTIMMWIRRDAENGGSLDYLFSANGNSLSYDSYRMPVQSDEALVLYWASSGGTMPSAWITGAGAIPAQGSTNWTHIAVEFPNNPEPNSRLWVNGAMVIEDNNPAFSPYLAVYDSFTLGFGYGPSFLADGTGSAFLGAIDDVRMYGRANWTTNEILSIMAEDPH